MGVNILFQVGNVLSCTRAGICRYGAYVLKINDNGSVVLHLADGNSDSVIMQLLPKIAKIEGDMSITELKMWAVSLMRASDELCLYVSPPHEKIDNSVLMTSLDRIMYNVWSKPHKGLWAVKC